MKFHCIFKRYSTNFVAIMQVLMDMFYQGESGNSSTTDSPLPPTSRKSLTYEEVVKELIHEEKQYQRDLQMIIHVFREELVKIVKDSRELDAIFANITEIYELTVTLLGSLEDVIEMSEEQSMPYIGNCFDGMDCGYFANKTILIIKLFK